MEQSRLKELLLRIEALRKCMNELISQNGLKDPKILEISRQLDELLLRYYEILKEKQ
ncbi:MAG: Spo0E like sporulation regulatory protein [Clostridiales bacterium]|nr:Spo0E like sporulation regulatory protein [Clostridiales bacterium]